MSFKWADPAELNHSNPIVTNKARKVAAIDPETLEVVIIFNNVIQAAETMAKQYFIHTPSRSLIMDVADEIGHALNKYHKECLGFYWKWVQ